MERYTIGSFEYLDNLSQSQKQKLPQSLQLAAPSVEAVLIRLLIGNIKINQISKNNLYNQNKNYTKLPYSTERNLTYLSLNAAFEIMDICEEDTIKIINLHFLKNRCNTELYKQLLNEVSFYFIHKDSPITAFVHLYRALEMISYSFPLIYTANALDYTGSYKDLQNFFKGEKTGELGFMKRFILELYKGNPILDTMLDISLLTDNYDEIIRELTLSFSGQAEFTNYNEVIRVKFKDFVGFFITIRNRYFHFLIGQGQKNILSLNYDAEDLFRAVNPVALNWLAIIITKITQVGFNSIQLPSSEV